MNQHTSLEDRLKALGSVLRKGPRLTDRMMDEVRESAADGSTPRRSTLAPRVAMRRRWQLLAAAAGTVSAISVGVWVVLALLPSPSVGWADVTKAIQSQKWIRGTVAYSDGRRGTMWLSPERQVWAFRSEGSFRFFDGRERAKYEYYHGSERITKLPLGEENAQRVLPVDALSQDKDALGPWLFGTEKIVDQKRREVTEAGKTWIEFEMVLWRGDVNQATLRVDPETKLPVYLLLTSPEDATEAFKWQFDYPPDGPTDIYALGVPREIQIDDRVPSAEALRVLDAIAASRAQIGDFRLMVAEQEDDRTFIVRRKGDRWRVDVCRGSDLPKSADGLALSDWFAERLKGFRQIPLYVCDGKTVYKNWGMANIERRIDLRAGRNPAPQDLMSGDGLGGLSGATSVKLACLVYPDLTPRRGWPFEFDPHPTDAPGCVLIKRSALSTIGSVAHEWYYIDPAKGHAVVRVELFMAPPDSPASPKANSGQSLRMEDFQLSPHGFWYPTVVHNTLREDKTTVRYQFDFKADLPDSLFTIDDAEVPKE